MGKAVKYGFIAIIGVSLSIPAALGAEGSQASFSGQRIRFAPGANSATLKGRVSQQEALLYTLGAKAGQSMTIQLNGDAKTHFDLSSAGDSNGQSMASSETDWSGTLPKDGDYRILVFTEDQVKAPFRLKITIK